mgnify:CR=1 FL=1
MKIEEAIRQKKFANNRQKGMVNLIYTNNWLINKQSVLLKQFGITLQQFNILRILRGQFPKPATIKLIKKRMLDHMSDASRIVEKLRIKELAERKVCPNDRRNVDVIITNKGLALLAEIDERKNEMDGFMSNLSDQELLQLNQLLDKLRG